MNVTLAQLFTAAHVLSAYEDDYPFDARVTLEVEHHVRHEDNKLRVTLDGIGYLIREDGKLLSAPPTVHGGEA